jgi:phage gp29-like protein
MALPNGFTTPIARILRPQAAYRWLLPQLASITPQYIEMILRGALMGDHVQQWELFDLMFDTWPELAAVEQELVAGVEKKKMIFEPYHDEDEKPTPTAIERMKLVSEAFRAMDPSPSADENDMRGTIKDVLDGWFRGVTALEIMWQTEETDSGMIAAPRATAWVHPCYFAFDQDGFLRLRADRIQAASYGADYGPQPYMLVPFPPAQFLIGIHKGKSGPALGGAILRPLAWWWCAANFSSDWLLNLAQVFGLPFRWATYDQNAPQETVDRICDMLQNMGSAGWAAFPAGTTMELKEAEKGGANRSPQGDLLDRADRYARMLILGQTMSGGVTLLGKGGGQAFGTVEAQVKDERIDAASIYAQEIINRQFIRAILLLNYGDDTEAPNVRLLQVDEGGLEDAQRDAQLVQMGVPIGVNFLRKKYGIPEPAADEELVSGPQASPSPEDPNPDKPGAKNQRQSVKAKSGAQPLSDPEHLNALLKTASEQLAEAEASDLAPLRRAVEAAVANPTAGILLELLDELPRLQKQLGVTAAEVLRRTMNAALATGLTS